MLNLGRLAHLETLQLTQEIITKMTGNAHFGTPNPTLTVLQGQLTAATTAVNVYDAARQALTMLMTEREDAVDTLKASLRLLAAYVANASGGDAAIIQSSGMAIRPDSVPIGMPAAPQHLAAYFGPSEGTCVLDWEPVRGGVSYLVESATNPNGPWSSVTATTSSEVLAENLVSGLKYYFRVRALGAAGLGPWSDIAAKMAA